VQIVFYTWCLQRWSTRHWIAFIDSGEFIDTPGNETLREGLESFEDDESFGALGINWRMHSSAGLLTHPDSTRKAFTVCEADEIPESIWKGTENAHTKSIVKTSHAGGPINSHKFNLRPGTNTVGENGDVINTIAFREPVMRKRISLLHYAVKSREEFEKEIHKGNRMSEPKPESFWDHVENLMPHEDCPEMGGGILRFKVEYMDIWLRYAVCLTKSIAETGAQLFGIRGEVSLTPNGRRKELYLTSSNPGLVVISRPPKLFRDLLGVL